MCNPIECFRLPALAFCIIAVAGIGVGTECFATGYWSSDGEFALECGPLNTANGTGYANPGQVVKFYVKQFIEKDVWHPDEGPDTQHSDGSRQGKLYKSAASFSGFNLDETFTGPTVISFTIPENAPSGGWIQLKLAAGDTRTGDDERKDGMNEFGTYTIHVAVGCPETIEVAGSTANLPDTIPAQTTEGYKIFVMQASGGNPPDPPDSWNGFIVTEELGEPVWNDEEDFDTLAVNGPEGIHGSFILKSFTFGGNNYEEAFLDQHSFSFPGIVLKVGVNNASMQRDQEYFCTVPEEEDELGSFVITRLFTRQGTNPNDYVRVTVAK
jgi:hypothetical protein